MQKYIVNLIVEKYLNLKLSIEANLHVLQVINEIKIIQKVIVKKVNYHTVKLLRSMIRLSSVTCIRKVNKS